MFVPVYWRVILSLTLVLLHHGKFIRLVGGWISLSQSFPFSLLPSPSYIISVTLSASVLAVFSDVTSFSQSLFAYRKPMVFEYSRFKSLAGAHDI
ncbi:hypothetical protein K469DRAFT_713663 [Zopfia rhizophila CBS 207.26]|uniref:Uncharacterized protein n=1 Tax=Zopfia rhizophila CBS 207.26 TaxID=1314779 RepID=A0A6A6DRR6_9PEZI|nr:hypothetical protein K469DRAFT_713663 [Zopfia rhizophila CBS 207.26]